jgi:hypothetical protein
MQIGCRTPDVHLLLCASDDRVPSHHMTIGERKGKGCCGIHGWVELRCYVHGMWAAQEASAHLPHQATPNEAEDCIDDTVFLYP